MRRREFITLVGGAAVMGPRAARAQQAAKLPTMFLHGPEGYVATPISRELSFDLYLEKDNRTAGLITRAKSKRRT
jgi:hypothetical protein